MRLLILGIGVNEMSEKDKRPARRFKRNNIKYEEILTTAIAGITYSGRFIRVGKAKVEWEREGRGEVP